MVLTAAADPSSARREAAGRALPDVRLYDSFESLLFGEPGLDFIVLCTPPAFHGKQTLAALEKNLHVLCEKPLTLAPEELEEIETLAARQDRVVYTVHNWAFSPIWRQARQLLDSGAVGDVRHAELHVLRGRPAASAVPGDWRTDPRLSGGGILVDHGWHNLYLLRRLVQGPLEDLSVRLHRSGSGVEDEAALLFSFPESTGLIHLTWRAASRSNWALVYGSQGALELRDDLLLLRPALGPEQPFSFPEKLSAGSAHPSWNAAMLEDFKAEIDGRGRGDNLAEARFACESITKAYSAARRSPEAVAR
jgi:predicted dehydrogenase